MRKFSSNPILQSILRHFTTTTTTTNHHHLPPSFTRIPRKYRSQAIKQARNILTDYLHTTLTLPFSYAEQITKNSTHTLSALVSKVYISSTDFSKTFLRFLRYNPINEFEFFYESIGIDYAHVSKFLKPNVHFFSDDSNVLKVACTLAGFGFPWNKLGKLYVNKVSIFENEPTFLGSKFDGLLNLGFNTEQSVGICLVFPCLLSGKEVGLCGEFDALLDDLKRVFVLENCIVVGSVDYWYGVCRNVMIFYDLGFEKGKIGELIGKSNSAFVDYSEKDWIEKVEFFCKLGVGKEDVGMLILSNPEILGIQIDNRVISVLGFLNHFGLPKKELEPLLQRCWYVFGRNKMCNLPHILRALDLHEWFFHKMKLGKHQLLATYDLSSPNEGIDDEYVQNLEKVTSVRTASHSLTKLNFFHGIGFGENKFVMKLLFDVHGNGSNLQERFDLLVNEGIGFSKVCKMISYTPKLMNQEVDTLKSKIDFLLQETGLSLEFLETFPAFLIYNLEKRIKPRYRFHVWLTKQGWCTKKYTLSGIVAISRKGFLKQLATIHPTAPQLWLEQYEEKKTTRESKERVS